VLTGAALLIADLQGPDYDLFSRLQLFPLDPMGFSIGLGIAILLLLTGLYHAPNIGKWMDIAPLRILGAISYSVFLMHPLYIAINFTDVTFDTIGKKYEFWQTFPQMPAWYLPFVFFPGILLWASIMFVAVEKPCIAWGRKRRSPSLAPQTHIPLPQEG
jgi:peptidoglycan/LPS O-acetylase OafA/YrhL